MGHKTQAKIHQIICNNGEITLAELVELIGKTKTDCKLSELCWESTAENSLQPSNRCFATSRLALFSLLLFGAIGPEKRSVFTQPADASLVFVNSILIYSVHHLW